MSKCNMTPMTRREKIWAATAFLSIATLILHLGVSMYSNERIESSLAHSMQNSMVKSFNQNTPPSK